MRGFYLLCAMTFIKRILLVAFLFISAHGVAKSQVLISLLLGDKLNSDGLEFGLEGGYNWSGVTGLETSDLRSTFNLGFYFDIRLKDPWYFYTGTLVKSSLGVANLTMNDLNTLGISPRPEEGQYDQQINYFLVPAFIKYKFPNRFYLEAGPQFGLRSKGFVEFESNAKDPKVLVREDNKNDINRIDVGIAGGFGYKLKKGPRGMSVGVKYHHGLTSVYKDFKSYNRGFFLKINVPIGAGKKEDFESTEH